MKISKNGFPTTTDTYYYAFQISSSPLLPSAFSASSLPHELRVSFSEGAVAGTRKLLDLNLERDLPDLTVTSARLLPDDNDDDNDGGTFDLDVTRSSRNPGRISFLHLVTRTGLDRERRASYSPRVLLGLEGGGREERLRLRVEVLDINDNPPAFERDRYSVRANRSAPAGTELVRVRARDADAGRNARVTYHLGGDRDGARERRFFAVGREDGVLSTRSELSCPSDSDPDCPSCLLAPSTSPCRLLVYARDGGRPQQSAYAVITVSLVEGNDHDPTISFRHLPDRTKGYSVVSADAPAGASVAAVTVSDPDPGPHGRIDSLQIASGPASGLFVLERFPGAGNLFLVKVTSASASVRRGLRRGRRFRLALTARDAGTPPRTGEATLEIRVEDKKEFK